MRIFAKNPKLDDVEKTWLSDDTLAGAIAWPVKNAEGFANGDRVLMGEISRERTELLTIDADPTVTGLATEAADFPHDADDPVYAIKYDQMRIRRSTGGIDGSYSLLDTIDLDVDNEEGKTWYEDPNSLPGYFYTISFYDSVGATETDQSDPIAATGYTQDQIGSVILGVAKRVGDPDFIEFDPEVYISAANDVSTDLQTRAKRPYRFLKRNVPLDLAADSSTIDFPDDIWKINYVEVNDTSAVLVRVYRPKKVSTTEALARLAQTALGGNYVNGVAYDDEANQLVVYPKSLDARTAAFFFHYYKKFSQFTSFASLIEGPTRLAYKLALMREYYQMKADSNSKYSAKATQYDNWYNIEVSKLQREKNIDAGGPMSLGADRKRYAQFGGRSYRQ